MDMRDLYQQVILDHNRSPRNFREIEMFGGMKGRLPKKIAVGVVSHRNLQVDRPEDVADRAFDAFWRADSSRSATGRHAGLGLAQEMLYFFAK